MANAAERTSVVVGGITVDLDRETLSSSNGEIRLRPKTFAVLRYLLMHRGRVVTKQALIDAVWGDTSVTDDSLVQCLIEIRRALGDDDHRLIKTVPRRGYLVDDGDANAGALRAIRGPSSTIGTGRSFTLGTGWRGKVGLWSLLAVLAGGAAAAAMYLRDGSNPTLATPRGVPVVAVLPFRSLGPVAVEEYLQIGMADAVITRLSGLKALAVRPTVAVSYHAKEDGDPSVIGRRLRVDHVIDGSIQRSGDRVRVTTQLIEVATGRTKWAETFDEPFIDLFALQDAISTRIAGQLASALTAEERQALVRRHTGSLEAYELYLRGRFFWEKRTEANLRLAIGYFEQALRRDNRFALAYAGLAHCYYVLATSLAADVPLKVLPALRSAALKVAELDDQLAEAHTAMAGLYSSEWNERGEEAAYKRSIELNPNYPTAYLWYGRMLDRRGHYQESLAMRRRAYDLDPLNLQISVALADALYKTGHQDAALKQITRTLELDPEFWDAHHTLGLFHLDRGSYVEAVAAFEKSGRLSSLAHAHARAGDRDRAALLLRRLEHESTQRYVTPVDFAVVYAGLGENDRAFEWLERAFRERVGPVRLLDADARYAPLRADPRYTDLRRRIRDAHGR
jgi:DNA-binding winged helix-turn-helix (wHTH) protein/TolB-like protein/lipoprotein NlpI